jgi:hypothetical protein
LPHTAKASLPCRGTRQRQISLGKADVALGKGCFLGNVYVALGKGDSFGKALNN